MTFLVIAVCLFCFSCNRDAKMRIKSFEERSLIPGLEVENLVTVVSDSGRAKYRITTADWKVYDKADSPYWEFPKGIFLESFDKELVVQASIKSKYAMYEENTKVWSLKDSVEAVNLSGKKFESEELYWDQNAEKIYSNKFITITEKDRIIKGVGFESDQSMEHYIIKKPQGIFPIDE